MIPTLYLQPRKLHLSPSGKPYPHSRSRNGATAGLFMSYGPNQAESV
jgi:hypothetical protein